MTPATIQHICKCGSPARAGVMKRYYVNKKGILKVYEYPKDQCEKCANKKEYKTVRIQHI